MSPTSTISAEKAAAREAARSRQSGQFGEQSLTDPGAGVLAGTGPDKIDTLYSRIEPTERVEVMEAELRDVIDRIVNSGQLAAWLDQVSGGSMRDWSFQNQLLATLQGNARREAMLQADPHALDGLPQDLMVMTARRWQELYNRHPKRNESAIWILAPRTVKQKDKDTGVEEVRMIGVRGQSEFDVSQTEGDPLPEAMRVEFATFEVDADVIPHLVDRVGKLGYRYSEEEIDTQLTTHSKLGYTTADGTKRVVVDSRLSPAQKVSVLAHELGHIECGHIDGDYTEYLQHRGQMESEAEATAYVAKRRMGLPADDSMKFSGTYIAGWSKGDPETIRKALNKAVTAAKRITSGMVTGPA